MTGKGHVLLGTVRRLLTYKEHTIEMVVSIIKEMDLDPCANQTTKDLGASGLLDFSRVCSSQAMVFCVFCSFFS